MTTTENPTTLEDVQKAIAEDDAVDQILGNAPLPAKVAWAVRILLEDGTEAWASDLPDAVLGFPNARIFTTRKEAVIALGKLFERSACTGRKHQIVQDGDPVPVTVSLVQD